MKQPGLTLPSSKDNTRVVEAEVLSPQLCLEELLLLPDVSSVRSDLRSKVTEVLVKMQPEIASASVKAHRFVVKICDHRTRGG